MMIFFDVFHYDYQLKLLKLDLRNNNIEDQGALHVADALQDSMVTCHFWVIFLESFIIFSIDTNDTKSWFQ